MPNFSFQDTIDFFNKKMQLSPQQVDIDQEEVEMVIDNLNIVLKKGKLAGSLNLHLTLGLALQPLSQTRLKELAASNYLGINTGGCKLAFDPAGVSLCLQSISSSGTPPQKNWELLHRMLSVAREWTQVLNLWDEFVPLALLKEEREKRDPHDSR